MGGILTKYRLRARAWRCCRVHRSHSVSRCPCHSYPSVWLHLRPSPPPQSSDLSSRETLTSRTYLVSVLPAPLSFKSSPCSQSHHHLALTLTQPSPCTHSHSHHHLALTLTHTITLHSLSLTPSPCTQRTCASWVGSVRRKRVGW